MLDCVQNRGMNTSSHTRWARIACLILLVVFLASCVAGFGNPRPLIDSSGRKPTVGYPG
jgi:hypothetical protein